MWVISALSQNPAAGRDGRRVTLAGTAGVTTKCGQGVTDVKLDDPAAILRPEDLDSWSIGPPEAVPGPSA